MQRLGRFNEHGETVHSITEQQFLKAIQTVFKKRNFGFGYAFQLHKFVNQERFVVVKALAELTDIEWDDTNKRLKSRIPIKGPEAVNKAFDLYVFFGRHLLNEIRVKERKLSFEVKCRGQNGQKAPSGLESNPKSKKNFETYDEVAKFSKNGKREMELMQIFVQVAEKVSELSKLQLKNQKGKDSIKGKQSSVKNPESSNGITVFHSIYEKVTSGFSWKKKPAGLPQESWTGLRTPKIAGWPQEFWTDPRSKGRPKNVGVGAAEGRDGRPHPNAGLTLSQEREAGSSPEGAGKKP
ncbi:hypothetical protein DdX_19994 [Ditylenchus destructor]|uniref:Uncharacterized protein n=1 Tax=Ditylenchus destructor TaxID=166010 RepID=A0AAD4MHY0_9BILA|nr:hypothetical protein DdX_19994 [Ditylenchus destructor]